MLRSLSAFLLASFPAATGGLAPQQPVPAPVPRVAAHPIDLAICLDISGSMNGLIDATRQNLWAVVNQLAALEPVPTLRVALLTYGCSTHDPARGWVKVESGFTSDLDYISQQLFALKTNGGEEYVARVVRTAIDELSWSEDEQALRIMFVAGNEAATQDPQYAVAKQCRAAAGNGIVVNSIYCGPAGDGIAPGWRDVAKWAGGQFAAIDQDRQVVVTTPFDGPIAELSAALNATYVPYGAGGMENARQQGCQDGNAARQNVAAAAQRGQTKASSLYSNAHWDLVDACRDPKFELGKVDRSCLSVELRGLTDDQLRNHIVAQRARRDALSAQIAALGRQRDEFARRERQKQADGGRGGFDTVILEAVLQQAAAKGFHKRAEVATAPSLEGVFGAILEDAVKGYRTFPRVTGEAHRAPTDCRMAAPIAKFSAAVKEHGEKLYLLYARNAKGTQYLQPGVPAAVGETLVKEAWQAVDGEPQGTTMAAMEYGAPLVVRDTDGGKTCHAGDYYGLFVMHKLPADTPGTDQGWIYGTLDAKGNVMRAGALPSCMRCHQDGTDDRRFGLR